jgi:hypothetical protein
MTLTMPNLLRLPPVLRRRLTENVVMGDTRATS